MTTTRRPNTETAGNTFMIYVKGAKDLKEYIEWISKLVVDVSHELQRDLKEEKATVQRLQLCRGGPDFSAEMCAVAHRDLVYQMTELPQSSEYLQTTGIMLSSIQQLENIRKMLVRKKPRFEEFEKSSTWNVGPQQQRQRDRWIITTLAVTA